MEFFLDTASIADIECYQKLGLVDGVTTNPALLSKEGGDPIEQIKRIVSIVSGPVSAEVTYTEPEKMIEHGRKLAGLAENIVIKVPASVAGLTAANQLKKDGIKMNVTLIFHASQAVPFIHLGVDYVSSFVGRVEDFGLDNRKLVSDVTQAIDMMDSPTKQIAASIRNPDYLIEAICSGAEVLTVPPSCWEKTYHNPLFMLGESEFLQSWKELPEAARSTYESLE